MGIRLLGEGLSALMAALEMVRLDVAVPDPTVTVVGEKEQLRLLGRPMQARAIGSLKTPELEFAVIAKLAEPPLASVMLEGDALSEGETLDATPLQAGEYVTGPEMELAKLGFPTACTKS